MILNRTVTDPETQGDLLVGQASRCKLHDFPLPVCEVSSPAEFGKLIADETEKWGKVVKFAGAKPD